MLKKMLNTFAAKFLTLAMVMVALAPLVGNDATNAATPLMANAEELTSDVTPQMDALETATLSVGVNIPEGGYTIIEAATQTQKESKNGNQCPQKGEYYVCDTPQLNPGSFLVQFKPVAGYTTPDSVGVQLPLEGDTVYGNYVAEQPQNNTATLSVGVNIAGGGYTITEAATQTQKEDKNGNQCPQKGEYYTCDTPQLNPGSFLVQFKPVTGYTTPDSVGVQLPLEGDTVYGNYVKEGTQGNTATLSVGVNIQEGGYTITEAATQTQKEDKNGTDCTLKANYYTCDTPQLNPGAFLVQFKPVAGYTTPDSVGVQLPLEGDTVYGNYVKGGTEGNVNFQVYTRDNNGNSLNEEYVRNALTTHATPDNFSENLSNLNNYTFQFKNKPGYTTPGTVVVSNKAINNIPANVTVTENGNSYVTGTTLKANSTYRIVGTYVKQNGGDDEGPLFTVKKTYKEQLLSDGNKQVDYTITVKRNEDGPTGNYSIVVDDTVNDNGNRTLYGDNGGTMKVVQVNGSYSKCSNGCGDITAGPVTVQTTKPDQEVTLTYRMRSDHSGIPDNETSSFTNTVVGKYTYDGEEYDPSDKVTVNVPGEGDGEGALFTVDKQVVNEQTLSNGNKRVTYQITVKRNNNGPDGTYYILVDDTINDNNRTLTGSNGGTMKVELRNGVYSTCTSSHSSSNNCGDITAGPVNVKTTEEGEVVTMTYQTITDNSTVPANQLSSFVNTVVGRYTQDGETKEPKSEVTVTVSKGTGPVVPTPYPPTPAPAPPTPTPPATPQNGPGHMLLILAASALGAWAWQTAQRKKALANK